MASNRKKQDDKILKILRELVSLPGNKDCFDCKQRGPTYVNTTIGSFVCTRCSGLLRGLTPPHRVKSISMATFTQDEIDLLKNRGNEYCRNVWLAHYDYNQVQDTKDEQNVRDFMVAKYEKKRYYQDDMTNGTTSSSPQTTAPRQIQMQMPVPLGRPGHAVRAHAKALTPPQTAFTKPPLAQSPNMNAVRNVMLSPPASSAFAFPPAPAGDPFGSVASAQPSFANFDNNPAFNAPPIPALPSSASYPMGLKSAGRQSSEDKYAALKDLDSLMKQQQEPPAVVAPPPTQHNNSFTGGLSDWTNGPVEPAHSQSANPFATTFGPSTFTQAPSGFNPSPSNPFTNGFDTGNTSSAWPTLPTSHSMPFPVSWGSPSNLTVGPSNPRNPFL